MQFYGLNSSESFDSFLSPTSVLGGRPWFRSKLFFADGECWFGNPTITVSDRIKQRTEQCQPDCIPKVLGIDLMECLEQCFEVGGDSDGHHYFVSAQTGEFFVWWHDPEEITRIDLPPFSIEELVRWCVCRDPAYPSERKWCTFLDLVSDKCHAQTYHHVFGHPLKFPFQRVREQLAVFGEFEERFESEQVLALLQPSRRLLVEVEHDLRGRRCAIRLVINEALKADAFFVEHLMTFDTWLKTEGFCDIDDPSVLIDDDDRGQ